MVSWQARKAGHDVRRPGKDRADQRHLRRLAAIAQWMHEQAGDNGAEKRAVARRADLVAMLRDHIQRVEHWTRSSEDAEDEAESFLSFVRERAGLLIEAGADLYSFVHLTFQEYLTARHIIILSEARGDEYIWEKIRPLIAIPRWREVIRLLVAERQSEESKRTLTDRILTDGRNAEASSDKAAIAALAAGMLIDRVPAAMERAADVMEILLVAMAECTNNYESVSSALLAQLATLIHREENAGSFWDQATLQALERVGSDKRAQAGIVLATFAVPLQADRVSPLMSTLKQADMEAAALADGLLWGKSSIDPEGSKALNRLYSAMYYCAMRSIGTNLLASLVAGSLPGQSQRLLSGMMIGTSLMELSGRTGPFHDLALNNTSIHIASPFKSEERTSHKNSRLRTYKIKKQKVARDRTKKQVTKQEPLKVHGFRDRLLNRIQDRDQDRVWIEIGNRLKNPNQYRSLTDNIWSALVDERSVQDAVIDAVLLPLRVSHIPMWKEALRQHFLPALQSRHAVFRSEALNDIADNLAQGRIDDATVQTASCWLLVDAVVDLSSVPSFSLSSSLERLISVCGEVDHPILNFVRDLRQVRSGDGEFTEALVGQIDRPSPLLEEFFAKAVFYTNVG